MPAGPRIDSPCRLTRWTVRVWVIRAACTRSQLLYLVSSLLAPSTATLFESNSAVRSRAALKDAPPATGAGHPAPHASAPPSTIVVPVT